mgnify:CR=1 FL=1
MDSLELSEFQHLFRELYPRLLVYARGFVGFDNAEDVVEDVFVDLWRRRNEIDATINLKGMLYRAVYTRSINMLRHKGVTQNYIAMVMAFEERQEQVAVDYNPQEELENEDLRNMIEQAVSELPEKCQHVFRLSYMHGMKNKDIASALGMSVRTVDAHIYKALKYLRERLRNTYYSVLLMIFSSFL